ncbi:4679_t:CDS:2 [Cetraspora pellucida]|uniref:4679_t:CDS:1 n=1 Tax=Cetraspora pellucida TaxID=1433469 RepID=A0ACA9M8I8_9GLOM|nr:4679_t:CDS:2 [Cetraspora pellucida]
MNLCVGDIFKKDSNLKIITEEAIEVVTYFHRSDFFYSRLKDEQAAIYKGKYIALITPNDTCWNSHFYCFSSILKSKAALKNLMTKIEDGDDSSLYSFPTNIQENLSRRWICYYYTNWVNKTPLVILAELEQYRAEKNPFDQKTYNQFNNHLKFWNHVAGYTKELHLVAIKIFSISVASASVEWLFSKMGWIHTARRNRLMPDKVLKLCQLRDKLQRDHLNEALTKQEKKIRETNVAMQAQNTNLEISDNESVDLLSEEDIYEDTYNDIYVEDSYTKETNIENTNVEDTHFENSHIEDTHIENTYIEDIYIEELNKTNSGDIRNIDNWHYLVSKWIKLTDEDEINELVNNDSLNDNNANLDSFEDFGIMHSAEDHEDFGTTHPAEDCEAKWKLLDLFTDLLEQPAYLNLSIE